MGAPAFRARALRARGLCAAGARRAARAWKATSARPPWRPRVSQEAEADACEAALRRGGSDWRGLLADCTLGATAVSQLLHSALGSSTVDNASESAHNTLKPSVCTDPSRRHQCTCQRPWPLAQRPCYWSSAGSTNPASDDWLLYRLSPAGPMVIEALTLAPYCAFWQPIDPATGRYPTYWPDAVQVELRDGEGDVLYVSEAFRVNEEGLGGSSNAAEGSEATAASPQRFELRPPVLAARGGLELRVHLLGKRQRQTMFEADDHYVCVNYVLAEGKVLTAHQAEWVSREGGEPVPALNADELERFNPADSAPTAPPRVAMATCQSCGESAALKNDGAPRRALARSAATDSATRPPGAELALSRTAMRCSVCKMLRAPLACECGSAWFCNAECRRQSHVMRGRAPTHAARPRRRPLRGRRRAQRTRPRFSATSRTRRRARARASAMGPATQARARLRKLPCRSWRPLAPVARFSGGAAETATRMCRRQLQR